MNGMARIVGATDQWTSDLVAPLHNLLNGLPRHSTDREFNFAQRIHDVCKCDLNISFLLKCLEITVKVEFSGKQKWRLLIQIKYSTSLGLSVWGSMLLTSLLFVVVNHSCTVIPWLPSVLKLLMICTAHNSYKNCGTCLVGLQNIAWPYTLPFDTVQIIVPCPPCWVTLDVFRGRTHIRRFNWTNGWNFFFLQILNFFNEWTNNVNMVLISFCRFSITKMVFLFLRREIKW